MLLNQPTSLFLSSVFLALFIIPALQASVGDDGLTITYKQKEMLDTFRELVSSRLPHDYMKTDVYLIRWLRDRDFDIPAAERKLMVSLQWREENDIDNILNEDWTLFDAEYRIGVEGCDKDARPVVSVYAGEWDVRRAIVAGQSKLFTRYLAKLLEEAVTIVRKMQDRGDNVTQAVAVVDAGDFNLVQQGCFRCIPIYLEFLYYFEQYYPGYAHKVIAINTPQIAYPLWELYKPLVSPQTRRLIYIFGRQRSKWERALMSNVDDNQITTNFGGKKSEALDVQDLRANGRNYECPK